MVNSDRVFSGPESRVGYFTRDTREKDIIARGKVDNVANSGRGSLGPQTGSIAGKKDINCGKKESTRNQSNCFLQHHRQVYHIRGSIKIRQRPK